MSKFITHVHTLYSPDGWHNPECVLRFAEKEDAFVELLSHNSFLWTKLYREVFKSENIIPAIELCFENTDLVVAGENLDELAKWFPIFDRRVKRRLPVSLEEGIEILKENDIGYTYLPHPTAPISGAVNNGYEYIIEEVDGIEVWNGSIAPIRSYNMEALALAEKYNKTKLAGSDSHIGTIALKSCCNLTEASSKDEIYEAVRKNKLKPHINPLYPILLAKDYVVLAFLVCKDLLNSNLDTKPFISSLIKQLY